MVARIHMWRRQQRPNKESLGLPYYWDKWFQNVVQISRWRNPEVYIYIQPLKWRYIKKKLVSLNCRFYEETVERAKGLEASNLVRRTIRVEDRYPVGYSRSNPDKGIGRIFWGYQQRGRHLYKASCPASEHILNNIARWTSESRYKKRSSGKRKEQIFPVVWPE